MPEYGIGITIDIGFPEAVDEARAALAEQGFGVLTGIDVAATMKAKLGWNLPPYLILGACNPPLAHQALTIAPSIGLLLPCKSVVRSLDGRRTLVEAMDPGVIVTAVPGDQGSRASGGQSTPSNSSPRCDSLADVGSPITTGVADVLEGAVARCGKTDVARLRPARGVDHGQRRDGATLRVPATAAQVAA